MFKTFSRVDPILDTEGRHFIWRDAARHGSLRGPGRCERDRGVARPLFFTRNEVMP